MISLVFKLRIANRIWTPNSHRLKDSESLLLDYKKLADENLEELIGRDSFNGKIDEIIKLKPVFPNEIYNTRKKNAENILEKYYRWCGAYAVKINTLYNTNYSIQTNIVLPKNPGNSFSQEMWRNTNLMILGRVINKRQDKYVADAVDINNQNLLKPPEDIQKMLANIFPDNKIDQFFTKEILDNNPGFKKYVENYNQETSKRYNKYKDALKSTYIEQFEKNNQKNFNRNDKLRQNIRSKTLQRSNIKNPDPKDVIMRGITSSSARAIGNNRT